MGELAEKFGGKVDGELIRAADWNGLIEGLEGRIEGVETVFEARLTDVEGRLTTSEAELDAARNEISDLQGLANTVRNRYRQLQLSTSQNAFAIGQRAEIIARVTDFDGAPLDLSNAATRPWVDFVTVWGSLKAAPGFTSRAGTGGKTVAVQVNANGEARALLREQTGQNFAEEDELEIAAVLDTTISGTSIAQMFMAASTPAASDLNLAYTAVSNVYERTDTLVMRDYLDGVYLNNPTRAYQPLAPTFTLNWDDEYATVMAFVKPDDSPGTSDSAMAAGSIRVTFRDWVYPWIVDHYLPPPPPLVTDFVGVFTPLILLDAEPAVNGIFDAIQMEAAPLGLLGQQRRYAAAQEAIRTLPSDGPAFSATIAANVIGGLAVQQSLVYSAAISPGLGAVTEPARAVAGAGVRGQAAAEAVAGTVRAESASNVAAAETRILDLVRAENVKFSNDLLADNGPIRRAELVAVDAANKIEQVNFELGQKANMELVSQLLTVRDG